MSKIKFHHLHKLWRRPPAVGNIGERTKINTESELSELVSPPLVKAGVASEVRGGQHKPCSRPAVTQAVCGPLNRMKEPHMVEGLTLLMAVKKKKNEMFWKFKDFSCSNIAARY